jgi:hypothetical protein
MRDGEEGRQHEQLVGDGIQHRAHPGRPQAPREPTIDEVRCRGRRDYGELKAVVLGQRKRHRERDSQRRHRIRDREPRFHLPQVPPRG